MDEAGGPLEMITVRCGRHPVVVGLEMMYPGELRRVERHVVEGVLRERPHALVVVEPGLSDTGPSTNSTERMNESEGVLDRETRETERKARKDPAGDEEAPPAEIIAAAAGAQDAPTAGPEAAADLPVAADGETATAPAARAEAVTGKAPGMVDDERESGGVGGAGGGGGAGAGRGAGCGAV